MKCEKNFITMKLIWHDCLILSLDTYIHKTPTETSLMRLVSFWSQNQAAAHACAGALRGRRVWIGGSLS